MKRWLGMFALASLAGCQGYPVAPFVVNAADRPAADTAIFVAIDQTTGINSITTVSAVDGQRLACDWNYGCPVWVRVRPGAHQFQVNLQAGYYGRYQSSLAIPMTGMLPRHVYVTRYDIDTANMKLRYRVEDLGERPDFAIHLPFGPMPPTVHLPATF